MKKIKCGLFHGRFQHLHLGHQRIIDKMMSECDYPVLLVGSAQEKRTEKNPFNVQERLEIITTIYGPPHNNRLRIGFYPDLNIGVCQESPNYQNWGNRTIGFCKWFAGMLPDVIYGGPDAEISIFQECTQQFEYRILDRNDDAPSGTKVRQCLRDGNKDDWKNMVDPKLHDHYGFFKAKVLESS